MRTLISIPLTSAALFAALATVALPANAAQSASSVAGKASAVAQKTEDAVKHGVKKAASAVEHGAKKTGEAVNRGAKKIGLPTTPASSPASTQ